MTAVRYAIPSHARADRIGAWSLRALAAAGVPASDIDLFVAPAELADYKTAVDPGLYAELVPGAEGLRAQHAAIDAHYGDGARVVQLDDDLNGVVRRVNERQLEPVTDLPREVADAFALCADTGARLWGVYPTCNAGWMKARVRSGLVFCCGGLFGRVVDRNCGVVLGQKEDYERTLRYWQTDGLVLRVEWLALRTSMYRPGGLQADDQADRAALNADAVRYLMATWPAHVMLARRTGKAGAEVRLVA
jgi:hypothetical protein